ncbi:MAG TPA: hypothetical protein VLA34_04310 [Candidatus Krumholzibacterium sp.]|nr:hypothetical protein [Candidatus Krumholzibacterium sp.]
MISKDGTLSNTKKARVACIDLGSSYFRMLVAELREGPDSIEVVADRRRYVGWGRYLGLPGGIPQDVVASAASALGEMVGEAAMFSPDRTIVAGTNTLREAKGRAGLVSAMEEACGSGIRVLSQREEAEMTFIAATWGGAGTPGVTAEEGGERSSLDVVIDVGGTSSEIAWGRDGEMEGFTGIAAGAHTVLVAAVRRPALRPRPDRARTMMRAAAACLGEGLREGGAGHGRSGGLLSLLPAKAENHRIHLTGGTAVSIGILAGRMRGAGTLLTGSTVLSREELRLITDRLYAMPWGARARRLPLEESRIRLLPAGAALMRMIIDPMKGRDLTVVNRDLRWGMIIRGG